MAKTPQGAIKELQEDINRSINVKLDQTVAALRRATPVDTGRASRGWQARDYKGGNQVVIENPVPYIEPLNQGHSRQAPAGFVEATIQKYFK